MIKNIIAPRIGNPNTSFRLNLMIAASIANMIVSTSQVKNTPISNVNIFSSSFMLDKCGSCQDNFFSN